MSIIMSIPLEIQNSIFLMYLEVNKKELHNELGNYFIKNKKTEKRRKLYYESPEEYLWNETLYIKKICSFSKCRKIVPLFRYLFENRNSLTNREFQKYFKILIHEGLRGNFFNFEMIEYIYSGQINSFDFMYMKSI